MPAIFVGQTFQTVDEYYAAKARYEEEQNVPYVIGNSKTAKAHNSQQVDPLKCMPENMKWKELTMICKHNGKARFHKHKEGTKERPNQSTFKVDCHAKFNMCYNLERKCLVVTKLEATHSNHPQDPQKLKRYPEYRKPSKDTQSEVFALLDKEVKTHILKGLVMSKGNLVTSQDLQNIRNKYIALREGSGKISPVEALLDEIQKLKDEDPGAIVTVTHEPETFMIQNTFFQTSDMRISLQKYPEVLVMDTTYKLCDNDMPLVVFSVVDAFGAGRIAGYCLIISEKKEVVTASLKALLEGFPNLADKVVTVVIDKDQSEVAAIKKILPNADVHLCDFHVKKVFEKNVVKKLTEKWDEAEPLIDKLIHAFSEEEYVIAYSALQSCVGEKSQFMSYFDKNWHNSDLVWTEYRRNIVFSMGERTTGRVESHNAKIKKIISKKLPPALVIQKLRLLNSFSSNEAEQKTFNHLTKIHYNKYSSDPVIQEIRGANTPFVADLIERQYLRSLEPPSHNEHVTSVDECDCMMVKKYQLVCAHIFRERRKQGIEIYDHSQIPSRWTVVVSSSKDTEKEKLSVVDVIISPLKIPKRPKTMIMEDRYNMALGVCKRFCSKIANWQGAKFENNLKALLTIEDLCNLGKDFTVVGLDENHKPDIPILFLDENVEIVTEIAEDAETVLKNVQNPTPNNNIQDQPLQNNVPSFMDPNIRSRLQLPAKPPRKGRPPQRTKVQGLKMRTNRCGDLTSSQDVDLDDPSDVTKCDSCNGPVIRRTSFAKKNYGKKYVVCSKPTCAECKSFYKWVDTTHTDKLVASSSSLTLAAALQDWQKDCIVCIGSGPPTLQGGHKCCVCGVPVHGMDGAACCSVAVSLDEGFGSKSRKCLKCHSTEESTDVVHEENHIDRSDKSKNMTNNSQEIESDCSIGVPSKERIWKENSQEIESDSSTSVPADQSMKICEEIVWDASLSPGPLTDTAGSIEPPTCFACGMQAVRRRSQKEKTFGREFYACPSFPNHTTPRCKWINWIKQIKTPLKQKTSANHKSISKQKMHVKTKESPSHISKQRSLFDYFPQSNSNSLHSFSDDGMDQDLITACETASAAFSPKEQPTQFVQGEVLTITLDSDDDDDDSYCNFTNTVKSEHVDNNEEESQSYSSEGCSSGTKMDNSVQVNEVLACASNKPDLSLRAYVSQYDNSEEESQSYSSEGCSSGTKMDNSVQVNEVLACASNEPDLPPRAYVSQHDKNEEEFGNNSCEGTETDTIVKETNALASASNEPDLPPRSYVTLRRKRAINDEDSVLKEILLELENTAPVSRSRPVRTVQLPKRIRTSYQFDTP